MSIPHPTSTYKLEMEVQNLKALEIQRPSDAQESHAHVASFERYIYIDVKALGPVWASSKVLCCRV